ncbi:helix-turn-helix domain-containing protein [Tyzzerella sp. An114]|uniref:DUF6017 domain-containing protein n=1 Tax=Tyzzerella sp. An114 TaxID=1965545 RepID=UPI000B441BD2|nr:DUF6017 domain-containing protein [Tyzzerella sp. An114]OUQ57691.1 helix-turn-helix domain-containing protein [Tyzzerella sp. An114]
MAVFRVEKTKDYTVMANHHLRNTKLSLKAKGLLSLMLSLPEDWDYTTKGLSMICKDGVDSINATIKELEKNGYIVRKRLRNEKGQLSSTEYTIFERPQNIDNSDNKNDDDKHKRDYPELDKPMLEKPVLEKPILENPILDKPIQDYPKQEKPILENPAQLNTYISNTNLLNTDLSITNQSNPNQSSIDKSETETKDMIGYDDIGFKNIQEIRNTILNNIEYDFLKKRYNNERLDEIVDLMVETLCSSKAVMSIAGNKHPSQLVKDKFLKINSSHIDYVFESLSKTTSYIRNIKSYLLTVLFNAPSTMGNYYSALVNHDLHNTL